MSSHDQSRLTIDTRIDDIQFQITDLVRRRLEESGLSQEDAASRMQADLPTLARATNPRTALRLTVPQAIDLAYKAGLDLELQTSIQLDGLTLFHGGALKRSDHADGTTMMKALQSEAEKALLAHLAITGQTEKDYQDSVRALRSQSDIDFDSVTGAERMLAFLDYKGCNVEIASRIYDTPSANLLANPEGAAKAHATEPAPQPKAPPASKPAARATTIKPKHIPNRKAHSAEEVKPAASKATPKRLVVEASEPAKPTTPEKTPEQQTKQAHGDARRAMLTAQRTIAEAFAREVNKMGLSTKEVAEVLEVQPMWIRQICSDDWSHVSLRKTLDLSRKMGLPVELSVRATLDGEELPRGRTLRLADHKDGTDFLNLISRSLQPAMRRMQTLMKMTVDEMALESGISAAEMKMLTSGERCTVSPQRALGVLRSLGCELVVEAITPHHPALQASATEATPAAATPLPEKATTPAPKAAKPSLAEAAPAPRRGSKLAEQLQAHPAAIMGSTIKTRVGDVFEAHHKALIDGVASQIHASGLSRKEAADIMKAPVSYLNRAFDSGKVISPMMVMTIAEGAGMGTKAHLRIAGDKLSAEREVDLDSARFPTGAEFMSAMVEFSRSTLDEVVQADTRPQYEVAATLGISPSHLSNILSGRSTSTPQSLLSMAEKLNCDVTVKLHPTYDLERNRLRGADHEPEAEASPMPGRR